MLARDIVNYRGLARYLRPEIEEQLNDRDSVRIETIVMVIKRFNESQEHVNDPVESIKTVLADSTVCLTGDICYVTIDRAAADHDRVIDAYQELDAADTLKVHMLQSSDETGIICHRDHLATIEGYDLPVKREASDLALVIVTSPETILPADGIIAYLTRKIAMEGIHLVDLFTT